MTDESTASGDDTASERLDATEGEAVEGLGPTREADEETQADAGLDGGATEADEGERVGTDDPDEA